MPLSSCDVLLTWFPRIQFQLQEVLNVFNRDFEAQNDHKGKMPVALTPTALAFM
jgi:hypothetical protein